MAQGNRMMFASKKNCFLGSPLSDVGSISLMRCSSADIAEATKFRLCFQFLKLESPRVGRDMDLMESIEELVENNLDS